MKLKTRMSYLIKCSSFCFHYKVYPYLAKHECPVLANKVDLNQLAIKKPTDLDLHCLSLKVNFFQKHGSSNLIDWKLEVGMAS